MKTPRRLTNIEALSYYHAVLSTARTVPEISLALEKTGYNMDILAEGQVLLDKTRKIYDKNLLKKDTFTSARLSYVMKKKEMEATFRSHRSKALLIFRSNPRVLQQLAIDGKYPRVHDLWFETMRKFYTVAANDRKIGEGLKRLRLSREEMEAGLKNVANLEGLFATYLKRKGESQRMTVVKDRAFNELHDWMVVFFSVARMSLKRTPALMRSIERHLQTG